MIKSYTPLQLSIWPGQCKCWLRPSDLQTVVDSGGGSVSKVWDKSGRGNNVTQSTSGSRPRIDTNYQNGMPGLRFAYDGVRNDYLLFDSNDIFDSPFTIFVVAQSNVSDGVNGLIGRQTGSELGSFVLRRESGGGVFNAFLFGTGGSSQIAKSSNNNANLHVLTFANGGGLGYSINNGGFTYGTARSGYDNTMTTTAALGASNGLGNNPLDGTIYEFVVYDEVMENSKIEGLSRYLINYWKLT